MKRDGARPLAAPRFFVPRRCAGWSLLELSVVLAIAAVLIFFTVRGYQPKEAIALQQAERLRNDLRHVQLLAITWNQPLRVSTTANVHLVKGEAGFSVTTIELVTEGDVPGIDNAKFQEIADAAKKGCPISKLLTGAEIKLQATLAK